MKVVAVFFGGVSVEHDVSLITGTLTLNSIDKQKFIPFPVYVHNDGIWYTGKELFDLDEYKNLDFKKLTRVAILGGKNEIFAIKGKGIKKLHNISVAINCMHGERGEDGCLSGLLSMCDIPTLSPSVLPSSVCMDKEFTKIFLKGIGVSCLDCILAKKQEDVLMVEEKFSYPVIIKPNKLGSSVGVSVARNRKEAMEGVRYALTFGESAVIEKCLDNFVEINCAAYLDKDGKVIVSECERPVGRTKILTFEDKYQGGERQFPAKINKSLSDKIKGITEKIYLSLGARGIIRIDYFVVGSEVLVNEINTVPGSLGYYFFTNTIKGFKEILTDMIALCEREYAKSTTFVKEYKTDILSGCGSKGSKQLKNSR